MARTLVLVVGDEPTFVDAVKLILEDHGFEAVGASSTSDYLDSANGWRFDLTIADVRSDTSGFEILTRLRQQYPSSATILTTGDHTKELIDCARILGVAAVLPKPFSPTSLIELAREILSTKPVCDDILPCS